MLFQPLYDAYLPMVKRAGGVPKLVHLTPPHWRFDRAMLEAAFSDADPDGGAEHPAQSGRRR